MLVGCFERGGVGGGGGEGGSLCISDCVLCHLPLSTSEALAKLLMHSHNLGYG